MSDTPQTLRKRRGVVKGSITRLDARLATLEGAPEQPGVLENAKHMLERLNVLGDNYRDLHMALIDILENTEELDKEQDALDEHDDLLASITVRLHSLIALLTKKPPTTPKPDEKQIVKKRLDQLQESISNVETVIGELPIEAKNSCRFQQYGEQLADHRKTLADINLQLLSLGIDSTDALSLQQSSLDTKLFDCSVIIKECLIGLATPAPTVAPTTSSSTTSHGAKLPKLEVPTFSGNLLNWTSFWEQFCISVHSRTTIDDAEKFVYLQNALKGGSAKDVIVGLTQSASNYEEAVRCLKERYDRPRMIHQAHVKAILGATPLQTGSGKEIRKLHNTCVQHLRSLKSLGYEPSSSFITSTIELKLDETTMFEWQKHSQDSKRVPDCKDLLDFLNLRTQASESSHADTKGSSKRENRKGNRDSIASFAATFNPTNPGQCALCKPDRHALYACPKFRGMTHDMKLSTLKSHNLCMNCLGSNHFVKQCKSIHRCKICQGLHHTLLHVEKNQIERKQTDVSQTDENKTINSNPAVIAQSLDVVSSHSAAGLKSNSLLMTTRVIVHSPDGTTIEARALLDNASSASFISERLAQTLRLPRRTQNVTISGITAFSHRAPVQSFATFAVTSLQQAKKRFEITAVVLPRVTCDLPCHPVPFKSHWNHISDLPLADPDFGTPGRIDLLLGVDVFVDALLHGRRYGPPGSPIAFKTAFGWVLAGSVASSTPSESIASHHVSCIAGDDILRKFWEVEDSPLSDSVLSPEERNAIQHFENTHSRSDTGHFIVPLPRRSESKPLGESRSKAVRRFLSLERSLHTRNQFDSFSAVMKEYFDLGHAEPVPHCDLSKPTEDVFYLPMHAVHKESSTTTKIRAVFDASMKTATGVSLNDILMVGPTVHAPLVDVLLRFRTHRIAIVSDVSKMYWAIELPSSDRDLHRFVWRDKPDGKLADYRMTRVTFVKQNALDFAYKYPIASKTVETEFYVDDCLTGEDTVERGIELQRQLQGLFNEAGFTLRKWNSSSPAVLEAISPELRDTQTSLTISDSEEVYTKTLGIQWHSVLDHFRLNVSNHSPLSETTKRSLVSDIARTYDVLGWFSPAIIKLKILLQRVWEAKIEWDDLVPDPIRDEWLTWRSQLKYLSQVHIPRCYFPKDVNIVSTQLHGFSDASENAYAGVVYICSTDTEGNHHISLVTAKTKVSPIKRLTIPRLELCGAHLLTKLLEKVKITLQIPTESVFAWTDSSIVLSWLDGSPRRFKTYVGNRISFILDHIPPSRWNHVPSEQNPADCASRGLFPQELIAHDLWWRSPEWLRREPSDWPKLAAVTISPSNEEKKEFCLFSHHSSSDPIIPSDRFSSFHKLIQVTAWSFRFINNCRSKGSRDNAKFLSVKEIIQAENYWLSLSQRDHFTREIDSLSSNMSLPASSPLLNLHPFVDFDGLLRVGGRLQNSELAFSAIHPVILHGKHSITKLIILAEHLRLLHAGPTLLLSSLNSRYHILGARKVVRSITRGCISCRRIVIRPKPQMMGQLPTERVSPDVVFENTGIDYAGPVYIKQGYTRKPTIIKAYVCIFVSLSVKAVHLELVSDLTTESFISTLRRFIARRGKPALLWSDHGSNFVGAQKELKELAQFLEDQKNQLTIL